MIKKAALLFLGVIAMIYMASGCNTKITSTEWGPTKTSTPICSPTVTFTITQTCTITQTSTITPTSTPVFGVFVGEAAAALISGYTTATSLHVAIYEDTAMGNSLTGASVTMGGWTLAENTPGTYDYVDAAAHLFTSGQTINLSIISSRGSVSSSVILSKQVVLTAPTSMESVPVSSGYAIQWSYPDGVPSGMSTLAVIVGATAYVNEDLPGPQISRVIPANTMTSGGFGIATIVTKNTGVITGATPGSCVFTCGWAGMNMFMTVP